MDNKVTTGEKTMIGKFSLLHRMERKFGKFAIKNLMLYIVSAMGIVFAVDFLMPDVGLVQLFFFNTAAIMDGEFWRVITFIFIPMEANFMLFTLLMLYFYWMIGSALEREWGAFKFNIFYLCGIMGTIAAGLITGFATNYFLNLSLFFAFAILYPNVEVRLFLVLPIKVKWLGLLNLALFGYMFVISDLNGRVALLVSVANVILFFGKDFFKMIKQWRRKAKWKRSTR